MRRNIIILSAKIGLAVAIVPVLIYANSQGADPRFSGAPGDDGTCAACHTGTALNAGGGNVVLTSSAGTQYQPGRQQTFHITINDALAKIYGFQMTARPDSNAAIAQAGDFTARSQQIVLCDDGTPKPSSGCLVQSESVQFIEQDSPLLTNTIDVTWTPPPSNVGTVTVYVAALAANGDGTTAGDHVYTTRLTLCPVLPGLQAAPAISSVVSASGFNSKAGIAPGTWMEIYGSNFAAATCGWQAADFNGANAPASLGGVSVTVGGKNAFIDYVSARQVNAQAPDTIPIGANVPVVITNAGGASAPYSLATSAVAPALLAPPQAPFQANGRQYAVAQLADGTFTGVPSHPLKAGDVIAMYGIGFGLPGAGTVAQQATGLSNVSFALDQTAAQVLYAGLAPGFVGLYQFNIQAPNVTAGDHRLRVTAGGATMSQLVYVSVGQ